MSYVLIQTPHFMGTSRDGNRGTDDSSAVLRKCLGPQAGNQYFSAMSVANRLLRQT